MLTPDLESSLLRLKRHGAQIGLIYVGIEDPPATFADSPVYDIRSALEGLHYERVGEAGPWARTDRLYANLRPPDPTEDVDLPTFVAGDEPELLDLGDADEPVPVAASAPSPASESQNPWARPDR